jgi:hypothetical protein
MTHRSNWLTTCIRLSLFFLATGSWLLFQAGSVQAQNLNRTLGALVSEKPVQNSLPLISGKKPATLVYSSNDFVGVAKTMDYFKNDLKMVSGNEAQLIVDEIPNAANIVLVGTVGQSKLIDQLVANKKIDLSVLNGKWEQFIIHVVEKPFDGVERALVIAGSDKRGTMFGVFEISKLMGVSPWYWWADVPVEQRSEVHVAANNFTMGEPAVKYRGIFLNDEEPALGRWAVEKFGGFNSGFYEKLFELQLRLKSNFLWPAMWWASFNSNDPKNTQLADDMGIVMSTSHHEPMNRAHAEWKPYGGKAWNYETNAEQLRQFWTEGIERTKNVETIITLAMRGDGDEAMGEDTNVELLQRIVADQRDIIKNVMGKPVTEVPQVWALYKEVQDYYDHGMRVPDDVTLLLCDDNWGNVRKLPKPGEVERAGGYGIYYHFDYVGGPRNYKWINTSPIHRTWEQMRMSYEHGVDRIWIVNVGDLKPMEFPISFFIDLAWNPKAIEANQLFEYTRQWAEDQFGTAHAKQIALMIDDYTRFNSRRKPELLEPGTYSLVHYREAERIVDDYNALAKQAQDLYEKMPQNYKDAYYQLVLYPIIGSANLNDLYVTVAKNRLYASQGRANANDLAQRAHLLFETDSLQSHYYNKILANGKWNNMMNQTRIGYTYWQQPERNAMPKVENFEPQAAAEMGVGIDGSTDWWPNSAAKAVLPAIDPIHNQKYYIDVFNRGTQPFDVVVKSGSKNVKVSVSKTKVEKELRIWVEANWKKAPKTITEVPITITGAGKSVQVMAVLDPLVNINRNERGFVESNGFVAIEAGNASRIVPQNEATWQLIPGFGRTHSGVVTLPMNSKSIELSANSPRMEYDVLFNSSGEITISTIIAPTLNIYNNEGLRFAISIDDEQPQLVNIHSWQKPWDWDESVRTNTLNMKTKHSITKPGKHTVKIWMVDPGIVVQRLLIDNGGLKPSYLGPLESKLLKN